MTPDSPLFPARAVVRIFADPEWSSGFFFARHLVLATVHGLKALRVGDPVRLERYDGEVFDGIIRAFYPPQWDRTISYVPYPDCAIIEVSGIDHATLPPRPLPLYAGALQQTSRGAALYGFHEASPEGTYQVARIDGYPLISGTMSSGYRILCDSGIAHGVSGSPVFTDDDGEVFAIVNTLEGTATPIHMIANSVPEVAQALAAARERAELTTMAPTTPVAIRSEIGEQAFVDAFLRTARDRARTGGASQALTDLELVIADASFEVLDESTSAAYLRLAASLTIFVRNDIPGARALLDRARAANADAAAIVDAQLLLAEGDMDGAIAALEGREDTEADVTRVSALYFARRPIDGLKAAEEAQVRHPDDLDVQRFLALLLLANGRREEALTVARAVHGASPTSLQARWTLGVVLYHARIPRELIPSALDNAPSPPARDMLISTPESVDAELEAAQLFAGVLATLEAPSEHTNAMEVWWIGALVLANRTDDASHAARAAVARVYPNAAVVPWILAYDLPVDISGWLTDLRGRADSGDATIGEILSYAQVDIVRGDGVEAERILDVTSAQFVDAHLDDARRFTMARALAKRRDYAGALEVLGDLDERLANTLRNASEHSDNLKIRNRSLALYADTNDATYLMESMEAAMRQGDYTWAATRADELAQRLPAPAAIVLALSALFNASRIADWERLFNAHIAAVADDDRVLTMQTAVLGRTGRWLDAVKVAERQVDAGPNAAALHRLAYVQEQLADHYGMAETARKFLEISPVDAGVAIQIASWLQASHPDLAGRLWDAAMAVGVPLQAVPTALLLAHALNRDDLTEPLIQRMSELVEQGMAMTGSVDDLRELLQERRTLVTDLNAQYHKGTVAIHALADIQDFPIAQSHLAVPAANERAAPAAWTSVYVRHPSRIAVAGADMRAVNRLAIDITSLHLLFSMGLLNAVEARWPAIVVAPHLGELTRAAERHYTSSQPARDAARAAVVSFVDSGRLGTYIAPNVEDPLAAALFPYEEAGGDDGVVVDWGSFLSPATGMPIDPQPGLVILRGIDPWMLIDALRDEGELTAVQAAESAQRLGPNRASAARTQQTVRGRPVRLVSNLAEWLHDAGILEPLMRIARSVTIDARMLDFARQSVTEAARAYQLGVSARAFADHCAVRLQSGAYTAAVAVEGFAARDNLRQSEQLRDALFATLSADVGPSGAIVVDDRFGNQWPDRDGCPIVSVLDLVHALHLEEAIDDRQFYSILLRMRSQALLYIPLNAAEILSYVRAAPVTNSLLVESAELRTLRRYVAFAISSLTAGPEDSAAWDAERAFSVATSGAIRTALVSLFVDASPNTEARARWIINHLWFDNLAHYSPLLRQMPDLPANAVADMAAGALFVNALMTEPPPDATIKRDDGP